MKYYPKITKLAVGFALSLILLFSAYTAWCSTRPMPESPAENSAWLVYWDMPKDPNKLPSKKYDSISYFAAYFSDEDQLTLPDDFDSAVLLNNDIPRRYLTIVNDVVSHNKNSLKSITLVKRTLDGNMKKIIYADKIIALAQKNGFNGIDLDYEQIFKDKYTAEEYIHFIKILYDKAYAQNIKLRVILEPSVKFAAYNFPRGPQYVVMMYNLYGLHSGPGPKADFAFIEQTSNSMKALPGPVGAAFSAGGCLWGSNGEKRFISSDQAEMLAQKHQTNTKRDEKSGALFFSYKDESINYTVWFADKKTIAEWSKKAGEMGINAISLWRLGDDE
ncbi:glycosyl hydrolase family 18 protein [Pectinatus haikarae]|uniref:GH18 domain-containing protein n=1 Tax=Pectinatus haikarae TaxID=349096 RepID=A0ABT9Y7V5_9FIRM|nr:glycosyl hydrolase family 18 protein [Pectinatus haikarae]MDQ0203713.1 hypothetical protein [Pectinatus haikarae]